MAEVPHRTSIDGNERNKSSSHAFLPPPVHPSSRPHVTGTTSSRLLNVSSRSRAEPPLHPLRAHAAPKLPSGITRNVSQFSPMPGSVEAFGEVLDFEDGSESVIDEEELSESQLRELYDEEEIDNFLHLFSAYVTEVRLPQNHKASPSNASLTDIVKEVETTDLDENMQASSDEEDSGWVSTQDSASAVESQPSQSTHPPSLPLANGPAELAANYLLRILPYPQPAPPPVTLSRLRLTAYRFYFAIVPAYVPLFSSLLKLATWQHEGTSLFYCAVYWISWYNNLILPGLILRLLYSLMWYKLMPHPTLQDLRQHRQEQHRADDFSRRVVVRLGSAPGFAVKDLLDVVKDFRSSRKTAATSKNEGKGEDTATAPDQTFDGSAVNDEVEVEHDAKLTQDEIEISRVALNAINQIIDLHERVKNIFLWRRPSASAIYGLVLLLLLFMTLLPAKYLVKLAGLAFGAMFWHVIPVLAAIPPAERSRLHPPFSDVPTDAEYAMELISQRVVRGLEIKPKRRRYKGSNLRTSSSYDLNNVDPASTSKQTSVLLDPSVNWKKWGTKVAETKSWAGDVKKIFRDGQWKSPSNWSSLTPNVALPAGRTESRVPTHTFPAQCKVPGLITLSESALFFTPLSSPTPSVTIPLESLIGMKKMGGVTNGLKFRWTRAEDEDVAENKFLWVGGRDELFARVISGQGKRWINV